MHRYALIVKTKERIPPFKDWTLTWDIMLQKTLWGGKGGKWVEVPFRKCPHGRRFPAEDIMSYTMRNSWIRYDSGRECNSKDCIRRYQEVL